MYMKRAEYRPLKQTKKAQLRTSGGHMLTCILLRWGKDYLSSPGIFLVLFKSNRQKQKGCIWQTGQIPGIPTNNSKQHQHMRKIGET